MISNSEFKAIAELNLEPIKVKLMHKESGEGWTLEYANTIEFEYRRFLYLMKKFPNVPAVPLFDVDIFWHYHILDTMKYMEDCEHVFGYYLHHFPYVGLRGEEDEKLHQEGGARMQQLYEETFEESYIRTDSSDNPKEATSKGASAYCAIPGKEQAASAQRTAFCYAPPKEPAASAQRTAYCFAPGKETAATI